MNPQDAAEDGEEGHDGREARLGGGEDKTGEERAPSQASPTSFQAPGEGGPPEDVVLSEMHMKSCPAGVVVRIFPGGAAALDAAEEGGTSDSSSSGERVEGGGAGGAVDGDGDLVVVRRCRPRLRKRRRRGAGAVGGDGEPWELLVHHAMATPLGGVGLQVWRGALLLVDWAAWRAELLRGKVVLELGAGTGVAGIAAARTARRVLLTDILDERVLDNASRNADVNSEAYEAGPGVCRVRALSWGDDAPWRQGGRDGGGGGGGGRYQWSREDVEDLGHVEVILAADCVYDDDLTSRLVECARELLRLPGPALGKRVLIAASEKRYNFSVTGLDVRAHAFDHFLCMLRAEGAGLSAVRVEVPQVAEYDRGGDLELWEVRAAL